VPAAARTSPRQEHVCRHVYLGPSCVAALPSPVVPCRLQFPLPPLLVGSGTTASGTSKRRKHVTTGCAGSRSKRCVLWMDMDSQWFVYKWGVDLDRSPAESVLRRGQVETEGSGSSSRNSGRAAFDPVRTQGSSSQSFPIRRIMEARRLVPRHAGPAGEKQDGTALSSTPPPAHPARWLLPRAALRRKGYDGHVRAVRCPRAHGRCEMTGRAIKDWREISTAQSSIRPGTGSGRRRD
jgi:hypothetical protein